jgi:hypothetical protein
MSTLELAGAGAPVSAGGARARSLLGDQRGAIMVLGIFMCSVIVGGLWYIAGIGDAIVYRERMQEAADAVAFSGATLHARGMNLIVMINLLMACVLAIRVILKALVLALRVVFGILTAICAIEPFGAWACAPAGIVEIAMDAVQTAQEEIDPIIDEVLTAMHELEVVIKTVVPPAALPGSMMVGDKYKQTVKKSLGVALGEVTSGLPVEDGSLDMLCGKAGEAVGTMIEWPLKKVGLDSGASLLKGITEKIVKAGGMYFCGFGGGSPPNIDDIINEQVDDICNQEKDGVIKNYQTALSNWHNGYTDDKQWPGMPPPTGKTYKGCSQVTPAAQCDDPDPFGLTTGIDEPQMKVDPKVPAAEAADLQTMFQDVTTKYDKYKEWTKDKCKNDRKQELKNQQAAGQTKNSTGNTDNKTPMMVKKEWKNGVQDSQFMSLAYGDVDILKIGARGVKVGAFKDKRQADVTGNTPYSAQYGFAQAEFFYDCEGAWDGDKCNNEHDSHEEAMWHFKWRARLRRYTAPNQIADDALYPALGELVKHTAAFGLPSLKDPLNAALAGQVYSLGQNITDPKKLVFH